MRTGTLTERLDSFVRSAGASASVFTSHGDGGMLWAVSIEWPGDAAAKADGGHRVTGMDEDLGEAITQALEQAGV